jgi:hypothetical protein
VPARPRGSFGPYERERLQLDLHDGRRPFLDEGIARPRKKRELHADQECGGSEKYGVDERGSSDLFGSVRGVLPIARP